MIELSVIVAQSQVDLFSDALEALDALSVSVEDADAHTDAEQPLFGEPNMPAPEQAWARSTVTALFPDAVSAEDAARVLQAQSFFAGAQQLQLKPVPEQDWVRLTQSQFTPVEITPSFWIVPSWHEPPAQARQVLRLDPGLAFGTGTHPTTRMCLRWIAARDLSGQRVLDYGCGSGILAMAAAQMGAAPIDAVDIDPDAVKSTLDNAQTNGVRLHAGLPELASGEYPLVVANILATPLKVLAPLLCAHVQAGGHLILAGILSRQVDELKAAYGPHLSLDVLDEEDGWVLMGAQRPTH